MRQREETVQSNKALALSIPSQKLVSSPHLLWLSSCSSFKNLLLLLLHPAAATGYHLITRAGAELVAVRAKSGRTDSKRPTRDTHSLSLSAHKKLFKKKLFPAREWSHLQQKAISDTFSFLCQIHYLSSSTHRQPSFVFFSKATLDFEPATSASLFTPAYVTSSNRSNRRNSSCYIVMLSIGDM